MKRAGQILLSLTRYTAMWAFTGNMCGVSFAAIMVTFSQNAMLGVARHIWAPGMLWMASVKVEIDGGDEIDWSKPHVFVANHQSSLDVMVSFISLPVPLRFVAKRMFLYLPFFGIYMWAVGMIFIDRARSRKAISSMKAAGKKIRAGASIIAFPEGTRSRDGKIAPFKKGIFMVALESGVPIVPLAMEGSGKVLPPDGIHILGGNVRARIGKPILTTDYGVDRRDDLMRDVRNAMIDLHISIGGAGGEKHTAPAAPAAKATKPAAEPA